MRALATRPSLCWPIVAALGSLALVLLPWSDHTGAHPGQLYLSESERFGVDQAQGRLSLYDLGALGATWYIDWDVARTPAHPNGAEFVQVVHTCDVSSLPISSTIVRAVAANPGALWLVGNEPDSPWQDNCLPDEYAQDYHDAYTLIKSLDPTAVVAAGGIIQATPLRIKYLDQALAAYQARYGDTLPADAWHIHAFVLREDRYGWGAHIPPGLSENTGMLYGLRDVDNMSYFREQIVRFRQWMAAHGWRDRPLHVPEYGQLMPADYVDEDGRPFDTARTRTFMLATFDHFRTATDAQLGYPADGNRLVQSWAWYSLSDNIYNDQWQLLNPMYNGDLFDCYITCTLNSLGQAYAAYVSPLVTPYVDLWPKSLGVDTGPAWLGTTATVTLTAEVANRGNLTSTASSLVRFASSAGTTGPDGPLGVVPPRYRGTVMVTATWTTWISGTSVITVTLDPLQTTADADRSNNTRPFTLTLLGDAAPQSVTFEPGVPLWAGSDVTVTAHAQIANPGDVAVRDVEVQFWREGLPLGAPLYVALLPAGGRVTHTATWTETTPGVKEIRVRASSPATGEKELVAGLLVARDRVFLPVVVRQ